MRVSLFKKMAVGFLLLSLMLGLGCAGQPHDDFAPSRSLGSHSSAVVYGADDRRDVFKHKNKRLQKLSESVALFVSSSYVKVDSKTKVVTLTGSKLTDKVLKSSSYGKKPLCSEEPFRLDPAPGSCTGFLIGKRIIASAGHCMVKSAAATPSALQTWCNGRRFVFGFQRNPDGTLRKLTEDDVYRCKRVLVHWYGTYGTKRLDIGTFELDRDVKGRAPLAFDLAPKFKLGDGLAVIGHPHGIPLKIADGAKVTNVRSSVLDYFSTNLDTSPGNSGSPVFSLSSYKVVGVHVRGARPVFKVDTKRQCNKTHTVPETPGRQSANYMNTSQAKKCKKDADCGSPTRLFCDKGLCHFQTMDLIIEKSEMTPKAISMGDKVTVKITVKNAGNHPIQLPFSVGLWWSTNNIICPNCGSDKNLAKGTINSLAPGASTTISLSFDAKDPVKKGKQFIGIYLDDRSRSGPSKIGMVPETSDTNNAKAIPVDVQSCKDSCKDSERRCGKDSVEVCKKNKDGCLAWETESACLAPKICKDGKCQLNCQHKCKKEGDRECYRDRVNQCWTNPKTGCLEWKPVAFCKSTEMCREGKCVKACQDDCLTVGSTRCEGNKIVSCQKQTSTCLGWSVSKTCGPDESCSASACVPKPKKKLGEACKEDSECESKVCAGEPSKICNVKCKKHDECTSLDAAPFCQKEMCQAIPKGACLKKEDCSSGQDCIENACKAEKGKEPEPKKPEETKGCGCSLSSENQRDSGLWLFMVFFCAFWSFRRRS